VAVDYFEGDPIQDSRDKPGFDHKAWIDKKLPRAKEISPKWIDAAMEKFGESCCQLIHERDVDLWSLNHPGNPETKYGTVGERYSFIHPSLKSF